MAKCGGGDKRKQNCFFRVGDECTYHHPCAWKLDGLEKSIKDSKESK
jgi:hypothetical protein